ncbi:MAG: hypothetical protein Q8N89_15375 [Azonexus sp.]|nr:hypothetical protein [Azonexus sp.]
MGSDTIKLRGAEQRALAKIEAGRAHCCRLLGCVDPGQLDADVRPVRRFEQAVSTTG